jgi:hypothetical protein
VRLPSSVQYQLKFDFKDIFAERRTPFTFTRPPFMLVSARVHKDLVREHQARILKSIPWSTFFLLLFLVFHGVL